MKTLLLILYAFSGVMIVSGIFLSVQSTLSRAVGTPVRFKLFGVFLRIGGMALLCFLILKYRDTSLFWGLVCFFLSSGLLLLYFSLVRRSSMR